MSDKKYIEDFEKCFLENEHLFDYGVTDKDKDGIYYYSETRTAWEIYLNARKKAQEEIDELASKCNGFWNIKNKDRFEKLEQQIQSLKDELKTEREAVKWSERLLTEAVSTDIDTDKSWQDRALDYLVYIRGNQADEVLS